eukprot:scaffold5364_cov134-Skeletonema_marinoi.AAC.4
MTNYRMQWHRHNSQANDFRCTLVSCSTRSNGNNDVASSAHVAATLQQLSYGNWECNADQ